MHKTPTFYPLFCQVSSLAPIVAGIYVNAFCATEHANMDQSMRRVASAVGFCGLCMGGLYRYYTTQLLDTAPPNNHNAKLKAKKPKMIFLESVQLLLSSEYLACIAVLVLSYGITIQFSDILWKNTVKELHPEPLEYQRYFATFSSNVGITTFFVIFFGRFVFLICE